MTQTVSIFMGPDRILSEVIDELSGEKGSNQRELRLESDEVRRLRPLLAYAWHLHERAGRTSDSEAALKRFAHDYLNGRIPTFE